MSDRRRRNTEDMSARQTVERYLASRRGERSDSSIESYRYRLKLFVEWLEGIGVDRVGDLRGYDFDEYETVRRGDGVAISTLKNEMSTIRNWVEYLEQIEAVDEGLHEKVHVPNVPDEDATDDTLLKPDDAVALLEYFRNDPETYGSRTHAWLELAWHTGARLGGLQGLDVRDFSPEKNYVDFVHRPNTGTRLKKGSDGERLVAFPEQVTEVLEWYLEHNRPDRHDDAGRQPLIPSQQGRPAETTVRYWSYEATFPCHTGECPHGKEIETCEFREHQQQSGCPSSRSPHQVRTGSITWQRDIGFPPEVVAERVNSSVEKIEKYYDKASKRQELENRRRPFVDQMDLSTETDHE